MIPDTVDIDEPSFQHFPPEAPLMGDPSYRDSRTGMKLSSGPKFDSTLRGSIAESNAISHPAAADSISRVSLELLEAVGTVDASDILDAVADQDW
jgi:hypothetical protein